MAITKFEASISLAFASGSFNTIYYFANIVTSFPKGQLAVFIGSRAMKFSAFRKLKGCGCSGVRELNLWRQANRLQVCTGVFLKEREKGMQALSAIQKIFEASPVTFETTAQTIHK